MLSNPITSFFGLVAVLCPIVGMIWPEAKAICEPLMAESVGLGLIAAADGAKRPGATH